MQLEDLGMEKKNLTSTIIIHSGTSINGGSVTILAESGDPIAISDITTLLLQPLGKIGLEAFHLPDVGSAPVAVQVWKPTSSITIGGTIHSSGAVEILSMAEANASGKAVFTSVFEKSAELTGRYGAALGYFQTDAAATILMQEGQ